MEITLVGKDSLKIRGKQATIVVNPLEKTASYNAAILLDGFVDKGKNVDEDALIITGPGEYEVGGIKITGHQNGEDTVYSFIVDGVEVLLGKTTELQKMHAKLKEYDVLLLNTDTTEDAAFATGLAMHAQIFYGENASEIVKALAKNEVKSTNRYQISQDKFPAEVETVLLA